jgi:hypothetical protein
MNSKKPPVNEVAKSPAKVENFKKEQSSLEKLYFKIHSPEFARIISHTNDLRKKCLGLIKKPVKKFDLPNNMEAFNLKEINKKYKIIKASNLNRSQKKELQLKEVYSSIPSIVNNDMKENDEFFLNNQLRNISEKSHGSKLSEHINIMLNKNRDLNTIQTIESTTEINSKLTRRNSISVNYSQSELKNQNIIGNGNRLSLLGRESIMTTYSKKSGLPSHHCRGRSLDTDKSDAKQVFIEELDQDIFRLTSEDFQQEKQETRNLPYKLNKSPVKSKNRNSLIASKRNLIDEMKNELVSIAKNTIVLPSIEKVRYSKESIKSLGEDSVRNRKKFDDKDEVIQVKKKFYKKYTHLVKEIEVQKSIHKSRNVFEDHEIDFIVSSNSQNEIEMLKNSFKSQLERAMISKNSRKTPSPKKRMNLLRVSNSSHINNFNPHIDSVLKSKLIGEMTNIHKRTKTKNKLISALERKTKEYNIFEEY